MSTINNGREPGALLPGVAAAQPDAADRRPRAERRAHHESFASTLAEKNAAPKRRAGTAGRPVERDASTSSATAVAVAAATAMPLVPVVPLVPLAPPVAAPVSARGTFDKLPAVDPALARGADMKLAPGAIPTRQAPAADAPMLAGTQDAATAVAEAVHAVAPSGASAELAAALAELTATTPTDAGDLPEAAPAAAETDATAALDVAATGPNASAAKPSSSGANDANTGGRPTRDTLPDVPAPPARAVSAADVTPIQLSGLARQARDTAPAPEGQAEASGTSTLVMHPTAAPAPASAAAEPTSAAPAPTEAVSDPESLERAQGAVGADGADLRIGGGDDALSLRITAEKNIVMVHATAADAGLAEALRASAGELRQALGVHGLELGKLTADTASTSTNGGAASGQPGNGRPDEQKSQPLEGSEPSATDAAPTSHEPRSIRRRGWVA